MEIKNREGNKMANFNFSNKKDEIENILSDMDSEFDKLNERIEELESEKEKLEERIEELEKELEDKNNE